MSRLDQYSNKRRDESGSRRRVPFSTRLAVHFGGFAVQLGALLFAFGMIFWWVFGAEGDLISSFKMMGEVKAAQGRVTNVEDTGISEGGSDSTPGTPIYRVFYEFDVDGVVYRDKCFGTGYYPSRGTPVEVEYAASDPAASTIRGQRKTPLGFFILLIGIFPGVGLVLMTVGLLRNAKAVRVLSVGKLARGRLVSKEPTNTRINKQTVYKFTFEFEDESGRSHRVTGRTHHTRLLEDEETERIIYNPNRPEDGVLVDTLPGKPQVDDNGQLQGVGLKALKLMILPMGGIAAHGLVAYFFYWN